MGKKVSRILIFVMAVMVLSGINISGQDGEVEPLSEIIRREQAGGERRSPGTIREEKRKSEEERGEPREEEIGIEEEVELKEKEDVEETVPEPYTRSVEMPEIEVGKKPSRLELLFLGKISEEKQILKQFGYEIFGIDEEEEEEEELAADEQLIDGELLDEKILEERQTTKLIEEVLKRKKQESLPLFPPAGFDENYVLGPGDEIQIFLSGEGVNIYLAKNMEKGKGAFLPLFTLPIDSEGKIYYPPVGTVHLWGKNITEAEAYLKSEMVKYIKDVKVSVSLRKVRRFPIFVVGEVKEPGMVLVNGFSTVMDALSIAGGVEKTGSLRNIVVKRNDEKIAELDIYDLLLHGKRSGDVLLKDRDVIVVPSIGDTVAAWGMVKRPGIFEVKGGETVSNLYAFAGGALPGANTTSMKLTTILLDGKKVVREINQEVADRELQNGDILTVTPLVDELKEFVELKGHVKNPGFYQWREGIRVKEILESEDNLLPEALFDYGEIIRRLPPDYSPEAISFNPREAIQGSPNHNIELKRGDMVTLFSVWDLRKKPFVRVEGEVENPGRYRWVKGMTIRDLIGKGGGLSRAARLDEAELWRYELEDNKYSIKLKRKINITGALEGDREENALLQPFDQIVVKGVGSFEQLIWKVTVKGEVVSPGTYPIKKGERISDLIERTGGMTEFSYTRGVVLLRKSVEDLQRKRLKILLTELQESLFIEEAESVAVAEASEAALRRQILEGRKELLKVLEGQLELVVGRVVVNIDREVGSFRGTDRDIELEDGDELFIPSVPSYVLMLGDVYNQIALTYDSGKGLRDYLGEVGGFTRRADKKGMYIIRADGTIVSNESSEFADTVYWDSGKKRFSSEGLYRVAIYPGDTIVVPTEIKFPIPWRPIIRDITEIIFRTVGTVAIIAEL